MAQDSPQKSVQQIGNERRRFLKIVRQVSETIGTEFFSMLVKQLRRALGAKCVYIAEFTGRQTKRVRVLAASMEGDRMETFEFPVAGSPDAEVALCNPCVYSRGVREMFSLDRRLRALEAEAWVRRPLEQCGRAGVRADRGPLQPAAGP